MTPRLLRDFKRETAPLWLAVNWLEIVLLVNLMTDVGMDASMIEASLRRSYRSHPALEDDGGG